MSRLSAVDEKTSPLLAEVYAQITKTRGRVSNSLRCLGHAPEGLGRFAALGEYARYRTVLSGREQEMVVLAISRGNEYAWTHHLPSALKAGITQQELDVLGAGGLPVTLSPAERAAMRYAREFLDLGNVSDATFAELKAHYTERQITDLTLVACYFIALTSVINALGVELEADFKPAAKPQA